MNSAKGGAKERLAIGELLQLRRLMTHNLLVFRIAMIKWGLMETGAVKKMVMLSAV